MHGSMTEQDGGAEDGLGTRLPRSQKKKMRIHWMKQKRKEGRADERRRRRRNRQERRNHVLHSMNEDERRRFMAAERQERAVSALVQLHRMEALYEYVADNTLTEDPDSVKPISAELPAVQNQEDTIGTLKSGRYEVELSTTADAPQQARIKEASRGVPAMCSGGTGDEARCNRPSSHKASAMVVDEDDCIERSGSSSSSEDDDQHKCSGAVSSKSSSDILAAKSLIQNCPSTSARYNYVDQLVQQRGVLRLCVNCSFEDIMLDHEVSSLAKQLSHCYLTLRRDEKCAVQLHLTSLGPDTKLYSALLHHGFPAWKCHTHRDLFSEVFAAHSNIIVLSPDSELELEDHLDPANVYVIGGLVDKSVFKNQSAEQASRLELQKRKLPLRKYSTNCINSVLNVNHVFDILNHVHQTGDWRHAIEKVLPNRKNATLSKFARRERLKAEAAVGSESGCTATVVPVRDEAKVAKESQWKGDRNYEYDTSAVLDADPLGAVE